MLLIDEKPLKLACTSLFVTDVGISESKCLMKYKIVRLGHGAFAI